ncbi:MAG: phosphatidate cytidylyltransferase [Metamycoplasmataceae bacterium]
MNFKKLSPVTIKIVMALFLAIIFTISLIVIVFGGVYGTWIGTIFFLLIAMVSIYEFSGLLITSRWWRIYVALIPILIVFIFPLENFDSLNASHNGDDVKEIIKNLRNQFIFKVGGVHAIGYLLFVVSIFIPFGFIFYTERKTNKDKKVFWTLLINFILLGITIFATALTIKFVLYWTIYKFTILTIILAGIICCDVFAYFGGITLGKIKILSRKLAPKISPNKTIIGFICGYSSSFLLLFFSLYFSNIFLTTFNINELQNISLVLVISLTIPLMAVIGDLAFSYIKRKFQVKDYSSLIPGHGGILDRFDSTIYGFLYFNFLFVVIFESFHQIIIF